jgi:hypothetical protein
MQRLFIIKRISAILLITLLLVSCKKEEVCNETEKNKPGEVISIEGPAQMNNGETIALTIGVKAGNEYCIKKAEGLIGVANDNYVQVTANLVYTGLRRDNSCSCYSQDKIYTLLYFTPTAKGTYVFGSSEKSSLNEGIKYIVTVY